MSSADTVCMSAPFRAELRSSRIAGSLYDIRYRQGLGWESSNFSADRQPGIYASPSRIRVPREGIIAPRLSSLSMRER